MRPTLPIFATSLFMSIGAVTAHGQAPIGEVFASDASVQGSVLLAGSGTQVMSGSQVSAGLRPANLKLSRGGIVRICPNTVVTVSSSPSGRALLYSMSKGEIEFHFDISSDADALQTPDYRIQLIGPGHFDLAMCTDERGELLMRGKNNSAAVIVSEMFGDGVYQVPAGSSVDFHGGSVRDVTPSTGRLCGCEEPPPIPQTKPATEVAKQEPPPPPPATQPPETHIQVDAPFIYKADEPNPEWMYTVAKLGTAKDSEIALKLAPTVIPPEPPRQAAPVKTAAVDRPKKESQGFFKRIGRFFGRIFGSG